jgi:hypothetical protein
MLTLLLPVIRDWTREAVVAAIAASDIPRERCILVLDAPGCEAWEQSLVDLGFDVELHLTGNPYPPEDRMARRPRWRVMRRLTQTLVPDGPVLCIEDDTIACLDIYTRLPAIGPHATGIQIARHRSRRPILYPRTAMKVGVHPVDGCGFGCLLTTGEAYRAATLGVDLPGPADKELTAQLPGLMADFGCVCGHMTRKGVLYP